ncbi:MAG: hypothetical protein CVT47_02720 [Thermoplasmata archaeon HGW-Thermoplasmata-2]|nr:MAG: hypothetical protein CVT47_02720 [Thermoplasmata archaeon HGW-Thermoplasmata-2]
MTGVRSVREKPLINPFEYKTISVGADFVDRIEEKKTLRNCMVSGQNVTLYSPRKYGKSSLIHECFRLIGKDCITAYIDMNVINGIGEFASALVESVSRAAYGKAEFFMRDIGNVLSGLRPVIRPEPDGFSVSVKIDEIERDLPDALSLPQKVAERRRKRVVVAIDEFQRIGEFGGGEIERLMRSEIQMQKNVSYVFSGSSVHMLREMFESGDRPFFQSTKMMELELMPPEYFKPYILSRFEETGFPIAPEIADEILALCGGHPQRTKELCFDLWNRAALGRPVPDVGGVKSALLELAKADGYVENAWNSLKAPQRRLLIALATEKDAQIYSSEIIRKYDLKSPSHIQRTIGSLEEKGILYKGKFADPFMMNWAAEAHPD